MNFTLLTALLCTFSWISVSLSDFHTVSVQHGEEVTLACTNFSIFPYHIHWFRLGNGPNVSCISSMFSSDANTTLCVGFQNGKFSMTSNTVTVFLNIKQVDLSDSGLYFCGLYSNGNSVIVHATYLNVAQEKFGGLPTLTSVILGGVIIFLIIFIISLVIKILRLHKAPDQRQNPQHSETLGSDALNYAAISFQPKPTTNRRSASQRQLEADAVYAATR
ncbi:uncharacterized protein LOC113157254 isoform X1 [Anabas testudineus]|uniref:uncharacterized protein LOC113157254 isoform X1 n=1 Tax=Anabas testudineus TaxID=64144 RepID=UPI000E45AAC4|nr:uncharacterized protein LOC113157254 isoform X1 [Anabas testudineus]